MLGIAYLSSRARLLLTLAVGGAIALRRGAGSGWASGHISRTSGSRSTGPYAHTRNPLYFGSFLIAAGFAIAAHWGAASGRDRLLGPHLRADDGAGAREHPGAVSGGVRRVFGQRPGLRSAA